MFFSITCEKSESNTHTTQLINHKWGQFKFKTVIFSPFTFLWNASASSARVTILVHHLLELRWRERLANFSTESIDSGIFPSIGNVELGNAGPASCLVLGALRLLL